jgi:hypothetical protein
VLFFDSNKNFHAHSNNEIGNGDHFLSILDLEFSVQFISEQKFLHPNRALFGTQDRKNTGIGKSQEWRCHAPSFL